MATTEKTRSRKKTVGETRIDLSEETRQAVVEILNQTLADLFDLFSQTKQAHWTVRGPNFFQLHELFDQIAATLLEPIDEVAERVAQLGGYPKGTARMSAANSQLEEFPERFGDIDHVDVMIDRFEIAANTVRANIDKTDNAGDKDTADLLTEISRSLDKQLWFLEAHHKRGEGRGER